MVVLLLGLLLLLGCDNTFSLGQWWGLGVDVVGKSDSKENPKSDLDLDLGFVKNLS